MQKFSAKLRINAYICDLSVGLAIAMPFMEYLFEICETYLKY